MGPNSLGVDNMGTPWGYHILDNAWIGYHFLDVDNMDTELMGCHSLGMAAIGYLLNGPYH